MRVPRQVVSMLSARSAATRSVVTGLPPGPWGVGVKSVQIADARRTEEDGRPRRLLTEVWYPAAVGVDAPRNAYRDFLGPGTPAIVAAAEAGWPEALFAAMDVRVCGSVVVADYLEYARSTSGTTPGTPAGFA